MSGVPHSRTLRTFVRYSVRIVAVGSPGSKYSSYVTAAQAAMALFMKSLSTRFLNPPILTVMSKYMASFFTASGCPASIMGYTGDFGLSITKVHFSGFHSRRSCKNGHRACGHILSIRLGVPAAPPVNVRSE